MARRLNWSDTWSSTAFCAIANVRLIFEAVAFGKWKLKTSVMCVWVSERRSQSQESEINPRPCRTPSSFCPSGCSWDCHKLLCRNRRAAISSWVTAWFISLIFLLRNRLSIRLNLIQSPWGWRQQVASKLRYQFMIPYGTTTQTRIAWLVTWLAKRLTAYQTASLLYKWCVVSVVVLLCEWFKLLAPEFFLNFSTPCV